MTEMPSHDAKPAQIPDALEGQVYRLMAAARAALDVATEALAMADERRSDILPVGGDLKIEGRRFEALRDGSRARRGVIGAYAPIGMRLSGNDSYLRGCRYFPLAYRLRSSTNFLISDASMGLLK